MGHRHLPVDILLKNGKTRHLNLGDWIHYFSYAVFDGKELKIEFFEEGVKIAKEISDESCDKKISPAYEPGEKCAYAKIYEKLNKSHFQYRWA
mgnify:CR=1 FL=1